jgi:predicted outer membrane protein
MLRRVPRSLRRAILVALLLAVSASVIQSWTSTMPGTGGYVQTAFGPLGPADRDLLVKVRLAGLWEQPTGQQAEQQATGTEVKQVGGNISGEHGDLDVRVREVADQLGVLLPSRPNAQQLAWMNEISATTGSEYDRLFVQRLREAHGTVLPVIAEVRAGTRNDLVRAFAVEAEEYVSRHIEYLESTGLVDYAALPEPPSPGLFSGEPGLFDLVVPGLVFIAALLGAVGVIAAARHRDAARRDAHRRRAGGSGDGTALTPPPSLVTIPSAGAPEEERRPRHAIRR